MINHVFEVYIKKKKLVVTAHVRRMYFLMGIYNIIVICFVLLTTRNTQ